MSRTATALLALLAAAVLAGCGGADIDLDLTTSGSSTTYPEAADEICAEVTRRFAQAQSEAPRSFEQAEELMTALGDLARQGEDALGSVEPPQEDADAYDRYLDSRAEVVGLIDAGLAAARDGDGQGYEDARDEAEQGAGQRARLARAAGLRKCADGERG